MERRIGQTLGRYRIEARIGEGGMGVVYRAIDEKLRRPVALKVLADDVVNDPARRRRFLREARVAAALGHPNIAVVHDVGETEDGTIYIAMELVAGPTLRQRLERGPLEHETAIIIAKALARALLGAHRQGIVHRDLKPDNIMVSDALVVKVLDFGLAKPTELAPAATSSIVTEEGKLLGTPGYMSPEQAAGRAVDGRTDLFALGVVLYEMIRGSRPFQGASAIDVIIATARDEPASLRGVAESDVERVILRCLEKNADARFADATELLDALEQLGAQPDPSAAPRVARDPARDPGMVETQASLVGTTAPLHRRGLRSWRWLVGLGAVLAVILVARRALRGPTGRAPSVVPLATAVTGLPLPATSSDAVRAEYLAGTQALRDDDWGVAQAHFQRVVDQEPLLALGQLRLAMVAEGTLDESIRRDHFARAVTLRNQLSARDQGMLEALEPILQRLREDRVESVRRLEALSLRFPSDVEIQVWLGMLQGASAGGLAAVDRATALDPNDGQAWQTRGDILALQGHVDESRSAYERCGAISPGSAECFLGLIWLDSAEGRCLDAERDARRAVDRDPHLASNLACVMYGAGRPVEAVREIIDQLAATYTSTSPWQDLMDQTRLALITGDFVLARTLAERYQSLVSAIPHAPFREHFGPAEVLVGIARETGDDAQAFAIALDFAMRNDTWSKSTQGDVGIDGSRALERQAVGTGGLSLGDLAARRAVWVAEEQRNLAYPGLIWTYGFAASAETADEAKEALQVLSAYAPLASVVHYAGIPDAATGNAYLLAGRVDEAIPYLTRAVASCTAFRHPFVHMRAQLQLAEAHERKGDSQRACAMYRKVVDRWGNARPRSLSAAKARTRMTALGCGT